MLLYHKYQYFSRMDSWIKYVDNVAIYNTDKNVNGNNEIKSY